MEQCTTPGWLNYEEQESKAELKRLLAQSRAELEAVIMAARDEITRKEEEIFHMKDLLVVAFKERDEAQCQLQKLLIQKMDTFQRASGLKGGDTGIGAAKTASFSSSDSEDSVISEHFIARFSTPQSPTPSSSLPPLLAAALGKQRALPEKGKLLQAVMEAGPTLQTLLVAGPLPEWQRPPPQLDMIEIPPVTIPCSPRVHAHTPRMLSRQGSVASENGGDHLVNFPNNEKNKRRKGPLDSYYGAMSSPRCSNYQRVVQTS